MIRHIVLLDLPTGYDSAKLQSIMMGLSGLQSKIAGFVGFTQGINRDFEQMSTRYDYGFICDFADEATSQTYLSDPDHQALGAQLVRFCNGGADGIMVIDLDGGSDQ